MKIKSFIYLAFLIETIPGFCGPNGAANVADNPLNHIGSGLTPVQQRENNSITLQQQQIRAIQQTEKQRQSDLKQQEIADEIDRLKSVIISKSNEVQRVSALALTRTNVELCVKKLAELKKQLPVDPWRTVDGKCSFVKTDPRFQNHFVKVIQMTSEGVFCFFYDYDSSYYCDHYPYIQPNDATVSFLAVRTRVGFDYGIPCNRPSNADEIEKEATQIKSEEIDAIKSDAISAGIEVTNANIALDTARNDLNKFLDNLEAERQRKIQEANQKKQAILDKVLKSNQEAADKGDAYGLMRMGERYRDGEGVEKDIEKAKKYLQKAVAAGSPTASEELSKLK